jgi:lipoprotein-anchoring transpeptidase ErfK/SrfK
LALKRIFNQSLIIVCCTVGAFGAIKKYKHVFYTKSSKPQADLVVKTLEPQIKQEELSPQVVKYETPKLESSSVLPKVDRMHQLFTTGPNKLPIVETISFNTKVNWLEGRLAWIADYAAHFKTSRHFIARSLNGKADYFSQQVSQGNKFNVFKLDRPFEFHIAIDLSKCQMALYYFDQLTNERVALKTYSVGVGRRDEVKSSGYLTPTGTFKLGSKIAIYKPGIMGTFQDKKVEMIRVFGTRWLPFDPIDSAHDSAARGLGIHGLPWQDASDGENLQENITSIGCYSSDGCIRLTKDDIEELFAVVISKPCFVHIVHSIDEAKLPGIEVAQPSR